MTTTNSKVSRVQPVFGWLKNRKTRDWPQRLVELAEGLNHKPQCGAVIRVAFDPEEKVPPTAERLAWMIRNVERIVPQDGKLWREPLRRMANQEKTASALALLDAGQTQHLPRGLALEGCTHADCLIECEKALIWIEGKRFDLISPSAKWDVMRDQLSRNLESAWSLARKSRKEKDYCLIICHEYPLKYHEDLLVRGYRAGTWVAGWPHIPGKLRHEFGQRIGTVTWRKIADEWPAIQELYEVADLV